MVEQRSNYSITDKEIEHRLGFHRGTFPADFDMADIGRLTEFVGREDEHGVRATAPDHALIRQIFIQVAKAVRDITPVGRHQSLAMTAIEEAMHWSNAAVAMRAPLVEEG